MTMSLREENDTLKKRIADLEAKCASLRQTMYSLNYDKVVLIDNSRQLQKAKDESDKSLQNSQSVVDKLSKKIKMMEDQDSWDKSRFFAYVEAYKKNLKSLEDKICCLEKTNQDLMQKVVELQSEGDTKESEKEENAKIQDDLKKLHEDRDAMVKENSDLKKKISDCESYSAGIQLMMTKLEDKTKASERENANLKKKILAVESCFAKEKEEYLKNQAQKVNVSSNKDYEEKKNLELRNIKLSKQISDFEKIFFWIKRSLKLKEKYLRKKRRILKISLWNFQRK